MSVVLYKRNERGRFIEFIEIDNEEELERLVVEREANEGKLLDEIVRLKKELSTFPPKPPSPSRKEKILEMRIAEMEADEEKLIKKITKLKTDLADKSASLGRKVQLLEAQIVDMEIDEEKLVDKINKLETDLATFTSNPPSPSRKEKILDEQLAKMRDREKALLNEVANLNEYISQKEKKFQTHLEELEICEKEVFRVIDNLSENRSAQEIVESDLRNDLSIKENIQVELTKKHMALEKEREDLKIRLKKVQKENHEKSTQITSLSFEKDDLFQELGRERTQIIEYKRRLAAAKGEIVRLEEKVWNLETYVDEVKSENTYWKTFRSKTECF